jgi:predicted outer membrane protein
MRRCTRSSLPMILVLTFAGLPAGAWTDDTKPADATTGAEAPVPPPLLDENGQPFPPARPVAPPFNAEMAATRFAELAMADALLEIELGELVKRAGASPMVKDLGHRMATNHAAIRLILSKAAAGSGAALPQGLDARQQEVVDRLKVLSGPELDREYLWEETLRQPTTMAMYRWQYENCDDPNLKPFAVGTLPIIVVHARVVDEAHRKVNAEEIAVQERRAAAERKAEQERKQAEAQAAAEAAAKKTQRKFRK